MRSLTAQQPGPANAVPLGMRRGRAWRVWASVLAAVIVLPVAFWIAPHVYNNQLLLLQMVVYLILAQGVNVIYGFTGYLPFGYVGFFGAGAYGTALSVTWLHTGGIPATLLGGVGALLVAVILIPLLRLSGAYFALATLAASQAVYYVIANPSLAGVTKGPYGVDLSAIFNPDEAYLCAVILLGLTTAAVVYLKRSPFGLSLRAVRADPLSASVAGVNVPMARSVAWLVSAVVAGLAGGIFAWVTSVFYPDTVFSLNVSLFAIVFALFGGVGTVWGPLVGAIILDSLYEYVGVSQPQYFQLIYGVLIVVLMLFLPGGLASLRPGGLRDYGARRRRRRAPRSVATVEEVTSGD